MPERPVSAARALRFLLLLTQIGLIATILVAAVTFGAVYIVRGLDDAAYHVPGAVRIAQHLNPYFVDSPVDSHWYPAGAETLVAFFCLLTGSINATNISGAVGFILLCATVYCFAGLWSRAMWVRLSSVLATASTPLMLAQCLAFYVDIHLAAVTCAAFWQQAASTTRRSARSAYLALALALLAPAVKYGGLYVLAVLVPGCLLCLARAGNPRRPTIGIVVVMLASASFTYVRNWLERGNPVFPVDVPASLRWVVAVSPAPYESDPALVGVVERQPASFPNPWFPRTWPPEKLRPDMTADGFGLTMLTGIIGFVASLVLIGRLDPDRRTAWLLCTAQSAAIIVLFPLHVASPRYVLFLPVLGSVSIAVLDAEARTARARRTRSARRSDLARRRNLRSLDCDRPRERMVESRTIDRASGAVPAEWRAGHSVRPDWPLADRLHLRFREQHCSALRPGPHERACAAALPKLSVQSRA